MPPCRQGGDGPCQANRRGPGALGEIAMASGRHVSCVAAQQMQGLVIGGTDRQTLNIRSRGSWAAICFSALPGYQTDRPGWGTCVIPPFSSMPQRGIDIRPSVSRSKIGRRHLLKAVAETTNAESSDRKAPREWRDLKTLMRTANKLHRAFRELHECDDTTAAARRLRSTVPSGFPVGSVMVTSLPLP